MPASETIAAIATPPGQGGVGVVRLSGPDSLAVLRRVFRPSSPSFAGFRPRFLHHGRLLDAAGAVLDEGLAVQFPAPRSFTGEDVAELHCHGGVFLTRAVLQAVLDTGLARPAHPGEFSRRAFLHGKLDLAQAEAVAEAIAARSETALRQAQGRLSGALSARVLALREDLETLRLDACLAVDFPEDEVECLPPRRVRELGGRVLEGLASLAASHERTRLWREGALVVLAGRVNAGKSSLLNALLGRERAITSATPGTTRDWLEESMLLHGLPLRLVDTAGLRDAHDDVAADAEAEGIARSRALLDAADLVLLVRDVTRPEAEDQALRDVLASRPHLLVANKMDLLPPGTDIPGLAISARTGAGLDALLTAMHDALSRQSAPPPADALAPNLRQSQALRQAAEEMTAFLDDHAAGLPWDLLGVRLDVARARLDEILGREAPGELLDRIFASFCIGK